MKAEYQKFIDKKYGYGKADELTVAGKQVKKWSTFELALLKETYVKEIEKHLIGRPDKVVNWAERIVRKYG